MNYRHLLCALVVVGVYASCKKDNNTTTPPPPVDTTTAPPKHDTTAIERINDTAVAYSHDIYLWNTQIPDTFDGLKYAGPNEVMEGIRKYSKEPGFTDPVDHYSFAYKQVDWDNLSAGVTMDFGLNIFFLADGDLRVRAVEALSPAGLAGVRRGWKITKINGNTNITIANADFIVQNVYESTSSTITFLKPDGNSVDLALTAATYQSNPIYLDTVYTVGSKKVGYMVFNSFLGDIDAVSNEFQSVFANFVTNNVTDVVVDLRYNGGGYVSMSQELADYLVKPASNGTPMMTEKFNDNYPDFDTTTNFEKKGSLNISNVYFIVSDNTASASELLINNLKTQMNVKLVGETTYGKPVGFFPIPVGDWYIFPVSFRSTNSAGEGNYFNGIAVDKEVADGLDKDFGDVTESRLASVLGYINTGSFGYVSPGTSLNATLQSDVMQGNKKLIARAFKGSVGTMKDIRDRKNSFKK